MLEEDLARLRSVIAHGGSARDVDAALEPIDSASDPEAIAPLLLMLNDETADEALWPLLHAAERFDDATYIQHFLFALSGIVVGSGRWASILMMRVLNSDPSRVELVIQIRKAPAETRKAATFICNGINDRDIRFLAKTTGVLVAASNGS